MKIRPMFVAAVLLTVPTLGRAQVSGNIAFGEGGGKARAEQHERSKRTLTRHELPPSDTSMFVEANVLMNVRADQYVAVFGLAQEGKTVAECQEKMDAVIQNFTGALKQLGVGEDDFFVDFIAQNKIYGFELVEDIAQERHIGFELKKNISIQYQDHALLDKLVLAAAELQIFDLIKVDYHVQNMERVQERLIEEGAQIIQQKKARYERLLGVRLQPPAQIYAERPSVYYPSELYDAYTAYESEAIQNAHYRQRHTVQTARKSRTFFFNGLDADGFDRVVNPITTQPVVQFTLHLKVKYEVENPKPEEARQ